MACLSSAGPPSSSPSAASPQAPRVIEEDTENTMALRPRHDGAMGEVPPFYLLLSNISKATNVGKIVRSAVALGVAQIVVVGRRGVCFSAALAAQLGADGGDGEEEKEGGKEVKEMCAGREHDCCALPILHLDSYGAAAAHFHALGARVCGIEIMPQAVSLHGMPPPFSGPTAFVLGNEGSGLSPPQIGACDDFVYIPQFGQGIASLNVSCAAAVVMYTFAAWSSQQGASAAGAPKHNAT